MPGNLSFFGQVWGGGINNYRTSVLISRGYRFRYFRKRHGPWILVRHHRVGRVTTAASWVKLGVDFGNPSMEVILSCSVTRALKNNWDSADKLNTREYLPPRNSLWRTEVGERKVFPHGVWSHTRIHCVWFKGIPCSPDPGVQVRSWGPSSWENIMTNLTRWWWQNMG